jgi:hypothetical protein
MTLALSSTEAVSRILARSNESLIRDNFSSGKKFSHAPAGRSEASGGGVITPGRAFIMTTLMSSWKVKVINR